MALDKLTQITSSGINSTTPLNGISVSGIVTGGNATFDSVTATSGLNVTSGIVGITSGLNVTSGKVGIGTDNPGQELEVFGNDFTGIRIKSLRTGLTEQIGGVGFSTSSDQVATINALVDGTVIVKNTTSDTERLRIKSNGYVGIGTNNPEYDLDFGVGVASTIRLVSGPLGTAIRIGAGSNGNQVTLLRVDGGNPNHKGTTNNSAYGFSVKYMGDRAGNRNSLSIFSDNQTGTRHEAITILQDGRIGLGTDDPVGTNDENHAPVLTILNDPSTAVSYGTSDAFVVKSKNLDGTGISTVFAIRPFMPSGPVGATGHNPMYNVALSGTWFHFDASGQNFNYLADNSDRTYIGFYTGTSVDNLKAGEYTTLNGDGTPTAYSLAAINCTSNNGLTFNRGGGASADVSFRFVGKSTHGDTNKILRFTGNSYGLDVVNYASGDYSLYNTGQGNQIRTMDGSGGIELRYNSDGSKTLECDSGGIISPYIVNTTSSNTSNYVRIATTGYTLQRITSSRRYKNNIGIYTGGLSRISTITPRTWNDHKSGENIVGFIAEELHESGYTDAVTYTPWFGGSEVGIGDELSPMVGNGTTAITKTGEQLDDEVEVVDGISENTIICDLVLAVQELTSRISALESN